MNLTIRTSRSLDSNPESVRKRMLVREAAPFFAGQILPPAYTRMLTVTIRFVTYKTIQGHGACLGDQASAAPFPRVFDIWLDRALPSDLMIECLAHEFVHVRQVFRGDLIYSLQNGMWRLGWMGVDHTNTPYRERPWEIEATAKERPMAQAFFRQLKAAA